MTAAFSKFERLELLLNQLEGDLSKQKRINVEATQILKVEDINLAEGASLVINMNNTAVSLELINECKQIVASLKHFFPTKENNLSSAINHYKTEIVKSALIESGFIRKKAGDILGIDERQIRYIVDTSPEILKLIKNGRK